MLPVLLAIECELLHRGLFGAKKPASPGWATLPTPLRTCFLTLNCLLPYDGQPDLESRAFANFAGDVDLPAVRFHDAASQRQSKSRAVPLSGEERAKNVGEIFRRDAFAFIGNPDQHRIVVGLK